MDNYLPFVVGLGVGVFALAVPIQVLEFPRLKGRNFFWTWNEPGVPSWVAPCAQLAFLVPIVHFGWFFCQPNAGLPTSENGQFVLDNHGLKTVLTQVEYLALKQGELRVFSSLLFSCYLTIVLYWWFPRESEERKADMVAHN